MLNPDVNGDGVVDRQDLLLVVEVLEATANAPAAPALTEVNLLQWITEAKRRNPGDETFQKGIAVLEQFLANLRPTETVLLPNYPNPFNPETWIPYQLSGSADVTLTIYAVNGKLIQALALGHQPAGIYKNRNRAAYWDGKNEVGESVASGIYFYTLSAGDFIATRKMLIRK